MAQLPRAATAVIAEAKLLNYLLDLNHAVGASKARFFLARGFRRDQLDEFRAALRQHATRNAIRGTQATAYGTMFEVVCSIETPDRLDPCIRTFWLIESGAEIPRLTTAYPA